MRVTYFCAAICLFATNSCRPFSSTSDNLSTKLADVIEIKVKSKTILKDLPLPSNQPDVQIKCDIPEGSIIKVGAGPYRTNSNHVRIERPIVTSATGEEICKEFRGKKSYAFAPHLALPAEVPGKMIVSLAYTFYKSSTTQSEKLSPQEYCVIPKNTAVNIDPDYGTDGVAEIKDNHMKVKVIDGFPCALSAGWLYVEHFSDELNPGESSKPQTLPAPAAVSQTAPVGTAPVPVPASNKNRYASLAGSSNGVFLAPMPYYCQWDNANYQGRSCNMTSLAMALGYYGIDVSPMECIISAFNSGRDIANLDAIAAVAEKMLQQHGRTDVKVVKMQNPAATTEDVIRFLRQGSPVIAGGYFSGGSGHYLLVRGYNPTKNGFWVNDPAGAWDGVPRSGYAARGAACRSDTRDSVKMDETNEGISKYRTYNSGQRRFFTRSEMDAVMGEGKDWWIVAFQTK
jgi:hypothetical protein